MSEAGNAFALYPDFEDAVSACHQVPSSTTLLMGGNIMLASGATSANRVQLDIGRLYVSQ